MFGGMCVCLGSVVVTRVCVSDVCMGRWCVGEACVFGVVW